jgi:ApaG protein
MQGNGLIKKVKGEGVLGQQPIIKPSGTFQYISWSSMQNNFGKMEGIYYMVNTLNEEHFSVKIPSFLLVAPDLLN